MHHCLLILGICQLAENQQIYDPRLQMQIRIFPKKETMLEVVI